MTQRWDEWREALLLSGVQDAHTPSMRMRIRLSNHLAIKDATTAPVIGLTLAWLSGMWWLLPVVLVLFLPNIAPLWLNRRGAHGAARLLSILAACAWLAGLAVVLGEGCHVEIGLLVTLIGTMVLVPPDAPRRALLLALPVLSIGSVFAARWLLPLGEGLVPAAYQPAVFVLLCFIVAANLAEVVRSLLAESEERSTALSAASAAKSRFLAHMSHELRTPLAGVIGLTELALADPLPPRQRGLLEQSQSSAEHLMALLNGVLDLAKIEAGALEVESIDFDLRACVVTSAALVRLRAEEKGLSLDIHSTLPAPCWRKGDPLRVRQILVNLLGNAVKFTDHGAVTLCAAQRPDGTIVLSVSDTGIGMTDAQRAAVFAPFHQADASISRRFGGTGLGLSISHQLAALLGGELTCTSALGTGSTFTVTLPLPVGAPLAVVAEPVPTLPPGLRILVAEDNAVNQVVVQGLLQRLGQTARVVSDGQAAVDAALAEPWDIILMDMHMPVLGGIGATQALRAAGYPGAICALTANAMAEDAARCREAGMDGVLVKPVSIETLGRAIAAHTRPLQGTG